MTDSSSFHPPTGCDERVALVTGGSRGLGRCLVMALLDNGWHVVTDGRDGQTLRRLRDSVDAHAQLVTVQGDIADAAHRAELEAAIERHRRLDLLVNNASTLGATPLPPIAEQGDDNLERTLAVNLLAPHALTSALLPHLRAGAGAVINITSDAAREGYPGWGAYGASKAALEQWSNILAAEEERLAVYWVDPGDLRTDLHQEAFPGEDISDRPLPDVAVPGLLTLIDDRPPSGRFRAQDLVTP